MSVTEHGLDYNVLRRRRSRAGLVQLPAELEGVEPNWLPYVRVEDPATLAARTRSLGGEVVLEPRADVRQGTRAIVTDPIGGALGPAEVAPLVRGRRTAMIRMHAKRLLAVAFLVLLALGSVACNATVGVGVGVPIYGGWGPHGHWGPGAYGGIYVGGSIWP